MAATDNPVRKYACCGEYFPDLQTALGHFEKIHSVVLDNQPQPLSTGSSHDSVGPSSGSDPSPSLSSDKLVSLIPPCTFPDPILSSKPLNPHNQHNVSSSPSLAGKSVDLGSNTNNHTSNTPSKPLSLLYSKPFKCPKPNCTKAYNKESGLKYHISYGTCSDTPRKDVDHPQVETGLDSIRGATTSSRLSATSGSGLMDNLLPMSFKRLSQNVPAGSKSGINSNSPTSTTTSIPQVSLYRCPRPNCSRSYSQASGLRYHMKHGTCNAPPQKSSVEDVERIGQDLLEPVTTSNHNDGASSNTEEQQHASLTVTSNLSPTGLTSSPVVEAEREAEMRLRPFACRVGDCRRRYKNMNGLKYHYQHSGEHGAIGMALLTSGQHDTMTGGNGSISGSANVSAKGIETCSVGLSVDVPYPTSILRSSKSNPSMELSNSPQERASPPPESPVLTSVSLPDFGCFQAPTPLLRSPMHDKQLVKTPSSYTEWPADNHSALENLSKPSLRTRRRGCENCRRRKMKCDMSLFECSQCQRSGQQCSFGQAERGRSRYRTRRTQSVPDPQKAVLDLPSQLTSFPPPLPFPAGWLSSVKREKTNPDRRPKPRQAQLKANNEPKTFQQRRDTVEYKQIIPELPPLVSPGVSRPRSFSFYRATERDPHFGRPYSRPSSRSTSRPTSRPTSVHESPISTPGPWWKLSLQQDLVNEFIVPIPPPKPPSRLAIPLPTPPARKGRRQRTLRGHWGSTRTDHRRTLSRRYSRPPSPHPSRPSSRSSFSIPFERKSSFSGSSPIPISGSSSGPTSRPSSRSSYYSHAQYSPNASPKDHGAYWDQPHSTSAFYSQHASSHSDWEYTSTYREGTSAGYYSSTNNISSSGISSPNVKSLLRPPKLAPSAWQLYFTDWIQKHQASGTRKLNVAQAAKEAGQEYACLSAAEIEPYKRRSQAMKETREKEHEAYIRTLTPEDIKRENSFRAAQRKAGRSRMGNIKDPNAPKKPLSAYFKFLQKIRADPCLVARIFGDETETTKQSVLAAVKWRSMTDAERQPFLAEAEQEKIEYEAARRLYEAGTTGFDQNINFSILPESL